MKIGIITHYDVHNHGALLQLNALIQVLKKEFNAEAKALQYDKNYDFLGVELKAKYVLSFKSIKISIQSSNNSLTLLGITPSLIKFNLFK